MKSYIILHKGQAIVILSLFVLLVLGVFGVRAFQTGRQAAAVAAANSVQPVATTTATWQTPNPPYVLSLSDTQLNNIDAEAAVRINNAAVVCGAPSYTLNWGDGTVVNSPSVNCPTPSPGALVSTTTVTLYHTYPMPEYGSRFVQVTATSNGVSSSTWMMVLPPAAGQRIEGAISTSTSNNTVSFMYYPSYNACTPNNQYTINWGDGSSTVNGYTLNLVPGVSSPNSPVCLNYSGTFLVSHTYATHGTYLMTVQSMGLGFFAPVTVGR
jgi:hypothetical protein